MFVEIERKFLVLNDGYKRHCYKKVYIVQGFLNSSKERTVRVRILNDQGFITVKGIEDTQQLRRFEWEKQILMEEAKRLLLLCEKEIIEKHRYFVKVNEYIFEVDEFLNQNAGLAIAEIELENEHESFDKPVWLGEEVTGVSKYYNAELSKHPFAHWQK